MSIAAPLPKGVRRTDYTVTPGQTVFGPTTWLAFDPLDIAVWRRASEAVAWQLVSSGVTVTLSAAAIGFVTATFAVAQTTGWQVRIESRRVHDRMTDVTRASSLITASLERELDKVAAVLQELRRDVDEADSSTAVQARDEAVAARDEVRERYLGSFDHGPEEPELGFPVVEGALFHLKDQPDPEDNGLRIRLAGVWERLGILPAAVDRSILVVPAAAATVIPVPGGYTAGFITVIVNGIEQRQGETCGTGDADPDCVATDGENVEFPAGTFDGVAWVRFEMRRPYAITDIAAADVEFTPPGGGPVITAQQAIEALDTAKVPTTRAIGVSGGLLTGGGDLSANRTIGLTRALAADIVTGTAEDKVPAAKDVKDAIALLGASPAYALVAQGVTAAQATLDIALSGGFKFYELWLDEFVPVTAGQALLMRIATDGVPTFSTAASYIGTGRRTNMSPADADWSSAAGNAFFLSQSQYAAQPASFRLGIFNPGPGHFGVVHSKSAYRRSDAGNYFEQIDMSGSFYGAGDRWTHIRLIFNSGNIAAGANYRLLGVN